MGEKIDKLVRPTKISGKKYIISFISNDSHFIWFERSNGCGLSTQTTNKTFNVPFLI